MEFMTKYAKANINFAVLAITLAALTLLAAPMLQAQQSPLKIGIVELNRALNMSSSGKRSKSILLVAKSQKESEIKSQELEIKNLLEEIETNIMLSKDAKAKKMEQLKARRRQFRTAVQEAQRTLLSQERKLTESVISELSTIVGIIGKEENFDFILEKSAGQVLMYSRIKFIDITNKVIERYDTLQETK